ncbi:MAG: PAS domain S-box protein [Bryobacteraceae bacterium]
MNPSYIDANESVAHRSSGALPLNYLQRYGLAVVSISVALGISLLLQHFGFRVPSALLLLFAVAISSWYAGAGPALLAATLSTISFYWYFVEPVHTIYIYRSQIPYFVIFTAFAALLSRFGTFRQRAEADLRRTHDQLRVERPKLGSRTIALLYFAFSSCWILFTDPLVHGLGLSNAYVLELSEAKGILFISSSTFLMYVLVEKALRQRHSVAAAYWQLVETAQEGVWSVDAEGKTVFANENMAAILGTSPGEMIGKSILPFVPREKKDELLNHLLQREQGPQEHFEFPFLRADGAQVWTLLRVSPVLRDGQHSGCLALVSDITKRKRAEEELHESETRFRAFVDHAGDALFVQDLEQGTIVDVNREACESLGYTRRELIGNTAVAFHLDSDRAEMESAAEQAAAGETVVGTHCHRRKDGSVFYVEANTSCFWYGGRRFLLHVSRDITDRLRAEQQRDRLRQLEADLAHINRVSMMGELAASVAHEVNQPLSGVVSNASAGLRWLAGDVPNLEEAREGLRRIVRDGKRAGQVIARIRALTRKAATPTEKLDLNETIGEVLTLIGDEARRKSVIVRTHFADDLSPVSGDRVQLQQVVLNLVMNAIEAMSVVDERARELAIGTRNIGPDQVQVTVQDSGTGIDPQTIDRIFDSFYTTKPGGMGMGLSISRSILQAQGGRIWATANDGRGTIFHFTLPKYHEEESNAEAAGI